MEMNFPLVSIVTAVYNGEEYLAECIQSVLAQSYSNWEYIIANNSSTDRTGEIAERYAKEDKRIRVHHFDEFVNVIESHNRALRLLSLESKYCKVVSADDMLFSDCVARLVEVAESSPAVGIVGSYLLRGGGKSWKVLCDGLPYTCSVFSGREICRGQLLGGTGPYVFGSPTSVLYRSDLIRNEKSFYPNSREQADLSVCYKILKTADFGMVHQVLSYSRVHKRTLGKEARRAGIQEGSFLMDLLEYGPVYLTNDEFEDRLRDALSDYYTYLAVGLLKFRDKKFWNYHKALLQEMGAPLLSARLAKALCLQLMEWLLNPKHTVEHMLGRHKQEMWK